jgi:uncharacterized cupredoxin-like copper-binding protein
MRGELAVGVAPKPTTTTTTTPTTGAVGTAKTTIDVSAVEYGFTLTENGQPVSSVPSGQVTFVVTDNGMTVHDFDLKTVHVGALLAPGQSQTWTVPLAPGTYGYQCDVPGHAQLGMTGTLTVTPDA